MIDHSLQMTQQRGFHTEIITDPETDIKIDFTIPDRYSNLKFLNFGAQGSVAWVKFPFCSVLNDLQS